ncbi:MAG: hypothetical protein MR967_04350 [Holdemanella sp.]|uniref:hypothetical protein n=1 Tax=Holdemanella sp. TaxID=1971762 RepID=UPI00258ACF64|nr:hypothetical protein [Holdemanella sp.]MCI7166158.1 hypothetical protein [Holdemanella sp.]
MLENINLNGAQVSAELHGFMYQGVYGYSGIYNFDNNCEAVIQSNNEIQLKSGLIVNKGRFLRIKGTESVMIQNGSSGVNRTDLIVARFTTDGINENHTLEVIKGTSESVPSYTNGDIYNGATTCELPLYAVHLTGTKVDTVTQVCDTVYSDYQNITYNLSNENQVINGNFAINQRGKTTYNNDTWTNAYTVDRWMSEKSKVDVNSNGTVTITSLSTNGSSVWFKQLLEDTIEGACTLSCEATSVTGDVYLFSQAKGIKVKQGINKITLSDLKQASFELKQGASITLKWVKLEQGSIATPFVAPNLAEELMRCKRYFQTCINEFNFMGSSATFSYATFFSEMRIKPTIKTIENYKNNVNSYQPVVFNIFNRYYIDTSINSVSGAFVLLKLKFELDAEIY